MGQTAGLIPQLACHRHRIDADLRPPSGLVADPVRQPMMDPAQRNHIFVAGLAAERARLQMPQMMRVGGLAAADQTELLGNMVQMIAVAVPPRRTDRQRTLVDPVGRPRRRLGVAVSSGTRPDVL